MRSNPHKIEIVITFLIEILELQNFGHMTTSTIELDFNDDVKDRNYDVIITVLQYLYFKKAWGSHFC